MATVSSKDRKTLEKYYLNFKKDTYSAGRYLNKENLERLTKQYPSLAQVQEDITVLEKYFGEKLEPKTLEEKEHQILTSRFAEGLAKENKETLTDIVVRAAKLRRSLG